MWRSGVAQHRDRKNGAKTAANEVASLSDDEIIMLPIF
jgi:hypothetical protein